MSTENCKQELMFDGDSLAISVWKGKYAAKDETHYSQMHRRMAKEFAKIERNYVLQSRKYLSSSHIKALSSRGQDDLLLNEEDVPNEHLLTMLEEEIYAYLKDFKFIIPQGSVMATLGTDDIASLSNCVVLEPPLDSYNSIMYVDTQLTALYRRRCGVGIDISNLRPNMSPVNNAAKYTAGFIPFMKRYSNTTREVAINGRRGALMLSVDINHPDVLDFIRVKRDLTQITGANISVRVNKKFLQAVENNEDYILRFPVDWDIPENFLTPNNSDIITDGMGHYWRKVNAKDVWNEIINSAHICAEPGILFWDNVLQGPDGVYEEYKPLCTNPCGEIPMSEDSCRLSCINLLSFVSKPYTKEATFDMQGFLNTVYYGIKLGDDLVDLEALAITKILKKIERDNEPLHQKQIELKTWLSLQEKGQNGRRIGLGLTAVGDTLAALGMDYGSDESLKFLKDVFHNKMKTELDATIDLSIVRGLPFKGFNPSLENNDFYEMIKEEFPHQYERMKRFGRRNISWSTMAPTGSVSILTRTSSGIEPLFQLYYTRRKKINLGENKKADFIDENGDAWEEYFIIHPQLIEYLKIRNGEDYVKNIHLIKKEELEQVVAESPWANSTANKIPWEKRLEVQAIAQKYTTHSISSTINLPKNTKPEIVSDIYMEANKKKLKGVTVYVDGSRSGILVNEVDNFPSHSAVRRPKITQAESFLIKIRGITYNIFIGFVLNKPYEIFIKTDSTIKDKGTIIKIKKKEYIFKKGDIEIPLTENIPDEYRAITRLVSLNLRHGTKIKYIVEQLLKCDGDIFSFTKSLARVLKKYIPSGEKSTLECEKCGSLNVVFEEGCMICKDCAYSKCN